MTFGFGYFPDAEDVRDWEAERVTAAAKLSALPTSASIRDSVLEVFDQGPAASCVAQAIAQGIRMTWAGQHLASWPPVPCRLVIYWQARAAHDSTHLDVGTHPRLAFKAIREYGFALESALPYDPAGVYTPPPPRVYRASYDQAGTLTYARLPDEPDARRLQIMASLAQGLPVVLALTVDDPFIAYKGGLWRYGGEPVGRHYVTLTGYDNEGVELVNSWGESWGLDGFGLVSWADVLNPLTTTDPYVITTAPVPVP
jgi:hypothetical protein